MGDIGILIGMAQSKIYWFCGRFREATISATTVHSISGIPSIARLPVPIKLPV